MGCGFVAKSWTPQVELTLKIQFARNGYPRAYIYIVKIAHKPCGTLKIVTQLKHTTQAWQIWKKGLRNVVSKELRKALYNAQISIT
jgi:hypothetical protein